MSSPFSVRPMEPGALHVVVTAVVFLRLGHWVALFKASPAFDQKRAVGLWIPGSAETSSRRQGRGWGLGLAGDPTQALPHLLSALFSEEGLCPAAMQAHLTDRPTDRPGGNALSGALAASHPAPRQCPAPCRLLPQEAPRRPQAAQPHRGKRGRGMTACHVAGVRILLLAQLLRTFARLLRGFLAATPAVLRGFVSSFEILPALPRALACSRWLPGHGAQRDHAPTSALPPSLAALTGLL